MTYATGWGSVKCHSNLAVLLPSGTAVALRLHTGYEGVGLAAGTGGRQPSPGLQEMRS